jgi:hypothetical protein
LEETTKNNFNSLLAILAMIIIGVLLMALFGELAKHFIPAGLLYFALINKVYFLAAAGLILFIGLGRTSLESIRNLIVFFVVLLVLVAVAYEVDVIASSALLTGGALEIARLPDRYAQLFLLSLDGISLVLGAIGAFMLLLKGLDKIKDYLTSASKN